MLVKHLLSRKEKGVLTIRPNMSVQNAARLMGKNNIGVLVISGSDRRPDGILSERDIVRGISKRGPDFLRSKAGDVCVQKVSCCTPGDDLHRVMQTMNKLGIRHMPVTANGILVAVISLTDILENHIMRRELV